MSRVHDDRRGSPSRVHDDRKGEPLARGAHVVADREAPARGTWSRYAGRTGWVATEDNDGEVGVSWSEGHRGAQSWFLPSELLVIVEPEERPRRSAESDEADPRALQCPTTLPEPSRATS